MALEYAKNDESKAVLGCAHTLLGIAVYLCKHASTVQVEENKRSVDIYYKIPM